MEEKVIDHTDRTRVRERVGCSVAGEMHLSEAKNMGRAKSRIGDQNKRSASQNIETAT